MGILTDAASPIPGTLLRRRNPIVPEIRHGNSASESTQRQLCRSPGFNFNDEKSFKLERFVLKILTIFLYLLNGLAFWYILLIIVCVTSWNPGPTPRS